MLASFTDESFVSRQYLEDLAFHIAAKMPLRAYRYMIVAMCMERDLTADLRNDIGAKLHPGLGPHCEDPMILQVAFLLDYSGHKLGGNSTLFITRLQAWTISS